MTLASPYRVCPRALFAALAGLLLAAACARQDGQFLSRHERIDLLIENGRVLDGLGNPAIDADVVVVGDEIVFVGDGAFSEADRQGRIARIIDADGRTVTPGFIDLHAHGDPLENPQFENFLAMGVTTITLGQDGSSPAVHDLDAWLRQVRESGLGPNLAMFVGHGTLRELAGIGMQAVPNDEDLKRMLSLLDESLDYAFGMSTGLEYNPGLNARAAELRQLAEVVGARNRMIMSHMRNEDDQQLERSIAELIDQGQYARVHVSHLKSVYGSGPERAQEILGILASARELGVIISADMYPYSASYTGIGILFPAWAKTAEQFAIAKKERRDELAAYLRERVNLRNGPEATLLGTEPYTGKTLAQLSFELELPFEDVLIDVIGPQGGSGAYFVMDDELQSVLFQDPFVGVCSDGSPSGFHPRGHGTFARIIERYVLQEGLLSLPQAVQKMTSFAASLLGIGDRGVIRPGMRADILVFDPQKVRETASYPAPHALALGFDIVIVNGRVVREDGRLAGVSVGRVLSPAP